MSKQDESKGADYEVGYGKPPKQHQFLPGESGNSRHRKRKKNETMDRMVARLRDEKVTVNGKRITKTELAITQTINNTIKSGKVRDLEALLKLFEKHGALSKADLAEEARAGADIAVAKIFGAFHRTFEIDPDDSISCDIEDLADAEMIMGCEHCGSKLRERWNTPGFLTRLKREATTTLYRLCTDRQKKLDTIRQLEMAKNP